jgi:hypothetical protein
MVSIAVRFDEGRADALRCAGNNSNFPFGAHDRLPASLLMAIAPKVALLIVTTLAEMLGQLMFSMCWRVVE